MRSTREPRGAVAPADRTWLPVAAFAFILVALVALVATPALVVQRVFDTTEEIGATLVPAYEGARELAFAMEERITLARSRILTDDPVYALRYRQAAEMEAAALRELAAVAPDLGGVARHHVDRLLVHASRRDSLEVAVLAGGGGVERYLSVLPEFDAIRDSMLVELNGFDQQLREFTAARIREEGRLARLQRWVSYLLGALAAAAAFVIAWFTRQQLDLRRDLQVTLAEANRQRALAERQGQDLQRAGEARSHLLRGVTHDIKNPLGAAKGYTELILLEIKAPLPEEARPLVEGIQRSLDEALSIIADLLDLARADSGGLRVERLECNVARLAGDAVADHRSSAEAAGHRMEAASDGAEVRAFTDPTRVIQVLGNLLSNAIKYTPAPGRIVVRTQFEEAEDGGRWATIRVDDTGPGIPESVRDTIFDEFTRLDEGGAQSGHGLGLAIARRIARLLDGDLTVEDAEGGGASFVLWLPVRREGED